MKFINAVHWAWYQPEGSSTVHVNKERMLKDFAVPLSEDAAKKFMETLFYPDAGGIKPAGHSCGVDEDGNIYALGAVPIYHGIN